MTSAENPEGMASHPLTAALPAFHRSFNLLSAMPLPFGCRSISLRCRSGLAQQLAAPLWPNLLVLSPHEIQLVLAGSAQHVAGEPAVLKLAGQLRSAAIPVEVRQRYRAG